MTAQMGWQTANALAACVVMGVASAGSMAAAAQLTPDYPTKPIRVIVVHGPGASSDIFARLVGQKLSDNWAQPVVVDNRPGAGGILAMEITKSAPPDGYTLVVTTEGMLGIAPSIYRKLSYDAVKDFVAITRLAASAYVLLVNPAVPATSVSELIQLAKSNPGKINFASGGIGTGVHFAGELLKSMASINMVHVSYKSSPQALTDLLGGHVQVLFAGVPVALPHVKTGRARALGVTTAHRTAALPEVPTIAEAGLPGYLVEPWWGMLAPAGTPKPIVTKLSTEIISILKTRQMREGLAQSGAEPIGDTPAQFAERIKAEMEKWAKVAREAGVRIE